MSYIDGVIKAPVSIFDVQRALATTDNDLGTLCQKATINPMAKFKPIRNSKIVMLAPQQGGTPSDRYSARFGFAAITPSITFDGINFDPHSKWQYLKPRGGSQNEPFRLTDFINEANPTGPGYDIHAVAPFAFGVEGMELTYNTTDGNGGVGLPLYVNSGVNSYYLNGGWNPDTCITMSEFLNFYSGGSYIGFAIRDIDQPSGGFVAVVTRHKLNSVSSSVPTVILRSANVIQSGMLSPEVAILHDGARAGHTFRFIAFLYSTFPSFVYDGTTYTDINAEYSVLTTTPNFSANSLEIYDNIDRHDIVAYLVQGGITGLTGFIQGPGVTLTLTSNTPVINPTDGREYYKYQIGGTVYGSFTTPSGHWNPDGDVRIHLKIASDGRPSYVNPDTGNFEYSVNVSMPNAGTTYNNVALLNFSSLSNPAYIYVEPAVAKNEDPYIKITAYATPSYAPEIVQINGTVSASSPRITT